ncbi:hypothetical protein DL98DRAFT_438671, partial [Cadophora sp. DSE1049]
SWKDFIMSSIAVEIPWVIIIFILIYMVWYYLVGLYYNVLPTNEEELRGALRFLLICNILYLYFNILDLDYYY